MTHRLWLAPLAVFSLVVIACGEETGPTQPAITENPAPSFAVAGGTWTTRAPMPTGRGELAGAVQNNSLGQPVFFAIGGLHTIQVRYLRTVEAYNFANNRWTPRASLPLALGRTNGVGVIGGKLYLSGGIHQPATGPLVYHPGLNVYDPVSNTWTRKADLPKRIANGVSGVINGKLYVLSGYCHDCGPDKIAGRLYRYDPVTNVWTALAWAPNPHMAGAGAVINGKFYVAGGVGRDSEPSNNLDVYDPVTNRWRTLAPMPTARLGAAGAALQNRFYVIGQYGRDYHERMNQVEAYDPLTNTWSTKTPMSPDRGYLAAASLTYGGRPYILAVGGFEHAAGGGNFNGAYTP